MGKDQQFGPELGWILMRISTNYGIRRQSRSVDIRNRRTAILHQYLQVPSESGYASDPFWYRIASDDIVSYPVTSFLHELFTAVAPG